MLFAVSWTIPSAARDAANDRFLKTGGLPPDGVKMLGRWHSPGTGEGFCICESDDANALAAWMMQWSDLFKLQITPVIDDEGAAKMIASRS
jgi:hypothetical protein